MMNTATSRLAISLPVVVDFQGTLARGVTQDLDLDSFSFWTDCQAPIGASISALFYFGRNIAYLPLTGRVAAVTQDIGEAAPRFRIDVNLSPLGNTERVSLSRHFKSWRPTCGFSTRRENMLARNSSPPIHVLSFPCS